MQRDDSHIESESHISYEYLEMIPTGDGKIKMVYRSGVKTTFGLLAIFSLLLFFLSSTTIFSDVTDWNVILVSFLSSLVSLWVVSRIDDYYYFDPQAQTLTKFSCYAQVTLKKIIYPYSKIFGMTVNGVWVKNRSGKYWVYEACIVFQDSTLLEMEDSTKEDGRDEFIAAAQNMAQTLGFDFYEIPAELNISSAPNVPNALQRLRSMTDEERGIFRDCYQP